MKNKIVISNFLFVLFIFLSFFLISYLFLPNLKSQSLETTTTNYNFEDEIEPLCNELSFQDNKNTEFYEVQTIDVEIGNLRKFYSNIISIIASGDRVIKPEYKEKFISRIKVEYKNGILCDYEAEVRLSGDWSDHIYVKKVIGSLDVKLLDGNIDGITKFKLFLPRTRNHENEIFVSTMMEQLGFLSPRTSFVNIRIDNYQGDKITINDFIFQEKFSKEMIEFNKFREGPLIETDESYRWDNIIENDFNEVNIKYFMPAKILNKYWAEKNYINSQISVEAIENYNKAIFNAEQPWTQLNYEFLGENKEMIYQFDAVLFALDSEHAITNHQRKFFFNKIENQFYPIYYDGDSLFLWSGREFKLRDDYENFKSLSAAALNIYQNSKINHKQLLEKLNNRGLSNSAEDLQNHVDRFYNNLKLIAENNRENKQKGWNYLIDKNLTNQLNLPSQNLNLIFYDENIQELQTCDINVDNCKNIELDSNELDLFSNIYLENEFNGVLFGTSPESFLNRFYEKSYFEKINLENNVFLIGFDKNKISINTKDKVVNLELLSLDSRIMIIGPGLLNGWNINLTTKVNPEYREIRIDENLLTGCLTFYNLEIKDVQVNVKQSICEDSFNVINSKGSMSTINISNALEDALDIDFSELSIEEIKISNSGNDCVDLSAGKYFIKKINASRCNDKGISIGEKSFVEVENAKISESLISIAVKDSSYLQLQQINGSANICFALYRKKQEFGPSYVEVGENNCDGIKPNYIQFGSELVFNND